MTCCCTGRVLSPDGENALTFIIGPRRHAADGQIHSYTAQDHVQIQHQPRSPELQRSLWRIDPAYCSCNVVARLIWCFRRARVIFIFIRREQTPQLGITQQLQGPLRTVLKPYFQGRGSVPPLPRSRDVNVLPHIWFFTKMRMICWWAMILQGFTKAVLDYCKRI